MNRSILALQHALAQHSPDAIADFWAKVETDTTPLIESVPDDEHSCDVTFFWRGLPSTQEVAVMQDWGTDGIPTLKMTLIPETDVWYLTRRMPADTRTTYQFAVVDLTIKHNAPYHLDPFNPRRHTAYHADLEKTQEFSIEFSYLELPQARPLYWSIARPDVPQGTVIRHQLGQRRVWVYTPYADSAQPSYPVFVCFDGREYLTGIPTPTILDNLIAEKRIPPLIAILIDPLDRWTELACSAAFADTVQNDILPTLATLYPLATDPAQRIIGGSSMGGLQAAYTALQSSDSFGAVLAQTGWFRWSPNEGESGWLIQQYAEVPQKSLRFYLDVGVLETAPMRDGGPTQLEVNRQMAAVLREKGYVLHYSEYSGGHDTLQIRETLADALMALIPFKPSL